MNPREWPAYLLIGGPLLIGVLLTGCAGTGAEPTASASARGSTQLRIVVDNGGSGRAAHADVTLACDPPGGTHPDSQRACAFLAAAAGRGEDPFAPVPKGRACAEIYGGPQTARVTGTWLGDRVKARFSRTDGCQIERWAQASPLFP